MSDRLHVVTLCGSLRRGSFNAALERSLPPLAPAGMALAAGPRIGEIPLYNADVQEAGFPPSVTALAAAIRAADGLVVCSPEYNWSIPGTLKNAVDWVSRVENQPFEDKPVVIYSAAGGMLGGARMQYHLRQSLMSIGAQIFARPEIFVTFAAKKFNDRRELADQPTIDLIKQNLAGFETFIRRFGKR
jgi:chromate reductase